ncbi:flippase-like domain-containing protein [bacterium]|nr:flippase-like domain-containing protein [bacterium]
MKRRWILWLLVFIFVGVVIARFDEVRHLAITLSHGHWGWVVAAAFGQLLFYVLYAAIYKVSFSAVGVHSRIFDLLPVVFVSIFINVAIPTGGTSGLALFIDDAARRGQSSARTAAGLILMLAADFSAFAVLLGLGLANLATLRDLKDYELAASSILLGIIAALSFALFLGLWRPWLLLHMLKMVQKAVNAIGHQFRKTNLLREHWAADNAMDFAAASAAIAAHPIKLTKAFGVSLVAHLVNFGSLYALFLAFYHPIHPGSLLSGYAIGNLFWIVSITPQGVGIVEGVMTLVFVTLGVPVGLAAIIVIAYRGLGFWLPMLTGFCLLHRVRSFKDFEHIQIDKHA